MRIKQIENLKLQAHHVSQEALPGLSRDLSVKESHSRDFFFFFWLARRQKGFKRSVIRGGADGRGMVSVSFYSLYYFIDRNS